MQLTIDMGAEAADAAVQALDFPGLSREGRLTFILRRSEGMFCRPHKAAVQ